MTSATVPVSPRYSGSADTAPLSAITTLFVHQLMPTSPFYGLSPVHLLIPLTLFGVVGALHGAWTHNIREHKTAMISLYIGAILIAGSLTLLPGRIMHAVAFGP